MELVFSIARSAGLSVFSLRQRLSQIAPSLPPLSLDAQQPFYRVDVGVSSEILHAMAPDWFFVHEHEFAADPEYVATFSSETILFIDNLLVLAFDPLEFVDAFHVIGAPSNVESPAHA